jgi:Na+/H+ antiporter NhaD/arsenite permease-like protein
MKRLFALTVLALILGVSSSFAQTPSSKTASFRQSIAAAVANTPLTMTTTRTRAAASGKSFWHTPWPYVIFGAAAAVIIVAANKGGSGTGGY